MLNHSKASRALCCLAVMGTVLTLTLTGCNQRGGDGQKPAAPGAVTVSVTHPKKETLVRVVEQPGSIQAYEETQLFARVPGYVSKVKKDIGDAVRGPKYDAAGRELEPGEVVAEIDVPELVEEVKQKKALTRQAEAEVEQARKALLAAEANIATAEAAVTEAKALYTRWESEAKRIAKLVASGTVDVQTGDETQHQFKAAAARVQSHEAVVRKAKADRDKAQADVQAAEARVDVTKAEAGRLLALLAYATIRAPYDGVVTRRNVNTGDFVQPGKSVGLFTISRLDPVRIVVAVPEADAELVQQQKSEVHLKIAALGNKSLTGTVTRTSWALEPGARTLRAEIDFPNKAGVLRPGMYVYARISSKLPPTWAVPSTALAKKGDKMVLFLIESDDGGKKVVGASVLVGRSDAQFTEILKVQKDGAEIPADDWPNLQVAARAAGLADGQAVMLEAAKK